MYFWIILFIGIVSLIMIYKIFINIKKEKNRKIFKIIVISVMTLLAFVTSIDGWKGNIYFQLSIILFVLGLIIFIYGIINVIKFRKFNFIILTPFLVMIFCFSGMYYGERDERKIYKISDMITNHYHDDEINNNKYEIIKKINLPKDMEIVIENNVLIIQYKNIIYYPYKRHIIYKNKEK
jgi:hypothetical protein